MVNLTELVPTYLREYITAVVQMIRLTGNRKMLWRSYHGQSALGEYSKDPHADTFEADYNGKRYRLFVYDPNTNESLTATPAMDAVLPKRPSYSLQVVDGAGHVELDFPRVQALEGLVAAVKEQLTDTDALKSTLKSLFAEDTASGTDNAEATKE